LPGPRAGLFCLLVSISAVSLGRLSYFLDFKVAKRAVYVYFNIHDSNIATAEFLVISAETTRTCWEIERK
jgi:hypothetical protein